MSFHPDREPMIVGILNVTPDSFSDGGLHDTQSDSIRHAVQMVADGAAIIDIGGESTRPGSDEVSLEEEMSRVLPVVRELVKELDVPVSIDTRKVEVARSAVEAGAAIINDVEASRLNPEMWHLAAESGVSYIAMHMQGMPKDMQHHPHYDDVLEEIHQFFADRLSRMESCGIARERVLLDTGIGFGKNLEHNLSILANLDYFHDLGCHQMLGVSRKSLFGKLLGLEVGERLVPSVAACLEALNLGVGVFRVHDVRETSLALRTIKELRQRRR
jgi:dihydropteroate synthase